MPHHKKSKGISEQSHNSYLNNGVLNPEILRKEQYIDIEKKKPGVSKNFETVFRTFSTNNIRLSNMADNKAHILISVNSIIISIILGVLVKNIDKYDYLVTPVVLLLSVSLLTIVFSIFATKPNLPKVNFSQNDVEQRKVNLFFFGNYCHLDFDYFSDIFSRVTDDPSFLTHTLKRDLFEQGLVLSKKYRMLKIAYSIFMYGIIISVMYFFFRARFH